MKSKSASSGVVAKARPVALIPRTTIKCNGYRFTASQRRVDSVLIFFFQVVPETHATYATYHLLKIRVKDAIRNQFSMSEWDFVKLCFNAALRPLLKLARNGALTGVVFVQLRGASLSALRRREGAVLLDPRDAEIKL
jgi:hypothetical protein